MLSETDLTHPINEELLKEAAAIKLERDLVKNRLQKLDETAKSVSEHVYQKVRQDYISKLKQTTEQLKALKKESDKELLILEEKKTRVETEVRLHQETIEEASLRHSLGEYKDEQHREVTEKETHEMERLKTALQAFKEGMERHHSLFKGEDLKEESISVTHEHTSRISATPELDTILGTPDQPTKGPVTQAPLQQAAPKKVAELCVLDGAKVVQTIPLDHNIQMGRSPSSDVILKELKVSRRHAEIQQIGGKYILVDLESSNGTFVGGKKVTEYTLQPGDEITIGNTKMVFKI